MKLKEEQHMGVELMQNLSVIQNTSAATLVNIILEKSIAHNVKITHIALHQLIYICYGKFYQLYGQLLADLEFEAWPSGPVVEEIFFAYCDLITDNTITIPLLCTADAKHNMLLYTLDSNPQDRDADILIDQIVEQYANQNPYFLIYLTHKPAGAWFKTIRRARSDSLNHTITEDDILNEFSNRKLWSVNSIAADPMFD